MSGRLEGKRVAIVVDNGFEQVEMTNPREALEKEGAETDLISPQEDEVKGWKHTEWGDRFDVDVALDEADADDYDALLLQGGVMNPDRLRRNETAIGFVRAFFEAGKPVASICHGPWTLIDAGVVEGRRMTSYHTIQTDLKNAGAQWVDQEVVVDQGLVTSRKPDDLPAFNRKMIEEFAEGARGPAEGSLDRVVDGATLDARRPVRTSDLDAALRPGESVEASAEFEIPATAEPGYLCAWRTPTPPSGH